MTTHAGGKSRVALQFFLPPEELRPYISTFYRMEIGGARSGMVTDWLHPEWTNLRYSPKGSVRAAIGGGEPQPVPQLNLTGPTSKATLFEARNGESWGVGILPLGWARFVGVQARKFSNRVFDPSTHPDLEHLAPLRPILAHKGDAPREKADALSRFFRQLLHRRSSRDDAIVRIQSAFTDPECHSVAEIAEQGSVSVRTLERFCHDAFGFPPQLLLRRQRFLRSLSQFMLDPTMKWIETLDRHYTDQAHFVRDFKFFMTMTPRDYAALEHPVLSAAAIARSEAAGDAMQVLQRPEPPPAS